MEKVDLLPCAILIPSLGRPHRLRDAAKNIRLNSDLDHDILWCVNGLRSKEVLDDLGERYIDDSDSDDLRYVTRMAKLMAWAVAESFKTVFFGSDDVVHHAAWLSTALDVMLRERKACVVVNDMRNPNGTQAIVRTDYLPFLTFDNAKVPFHLGYRHNYADTEQQITADKYGQHTRAMESRVEHLHPIYQNNASRPWDDTYRDAQKHWNEDASRFNRRIEGLMSEPDEVVAKKRKAIARLWDG